MYRWLDFQIDYIYKYIDYLLIVSSSINLKSWLCTSKVRFAPLVLCSLQDFLYVWCLIYPHQFESCNMLRIEQTRKHVSRYKWGRYNSFNFSSEVTLAYSLVLHFLYIWKWNGISSFYVPVFYKCNEKWCRRKHVNMTKRLKMSVSRIYFFKFCP